MKLPKKLLACSLGAFLLSSHILSAGATNSDINALQQEIDKNQNALNQINTQIDQYQAEQDELQTELDDQKSEMMNLMMDIAENEERIAETEEDIADANAELEKANALREEQYQSMLMHIQFMYEKGDDSLLMLLLSSGDLADMLNNAEYVESLYEYDNSILTEYETLVEAIEVLRSDLETKKDNLEVTKADLNDQKVQLDGIMASLQEKVDNYDALVAEAQQRASQYKNLIATSQQKITTIKQQQAAALAAANPKPSTTTSSGGSTATVSGSGTGAEIASYALQFVGNPYVWGGTSLTNGADCSGFIMSVYAAYGYSLPHSSYSMRSSGTGVDLANAQAGDIICYSGHVALYIGNGQIVHAKNSNSGIVTDNVYYGWGGTGPEILAVRRIIN